MHHLHVHLTSNYVQFIIVNVRSPDSFEYSIDDVLTVATGILRLALIQTAYQNVVAVDA